MRLHPCAYRWRSVLLRGTAGRASEHTLELACTLMIERTVTDEKDEGDYCVCSFKE